MVSLNTTSKTFVSKQKVMSAISLQNIECTSQCQFFVERKKRLCRMTVRPGHQYCGEHAPKTEEGKDDTRVPCPYDPKHTCYASKLEKHLSICNARPKAAPPHIEYNVNAPADAEVCARKPLSEIPKEVVLQVIEKVNCLYEKYIAGNISEAPQRAIHAALQQEFSKAGRAESSRRHLRQASSLLHIAEEAALVSDRSCYVELGAGRGHAWCTPDTASSVVVIDRAAPRHKRDNKLRERVSRVRADLKDLALGRLGEVGGSNAVVGFAKHLCGVATDYALRCMTSASVLDKTRGIVLATCCHHRCEHAGYVASRHLQELGISGEELNVMLGIVSWATCGDGRSRERRKLSQDRLTQQNNHRNALDENIDNELLKADQDSHNGFEESKADEYEVQPEHNYDSNIQSEQVDKRNTSLDDFGNKETLEKSSTLIEDRQNMYTDSKNVLVNTENVNIDNEHITDEDCVRNTEKQIEGQQNQQPLNYENTDEVTHKHNEYRELVNDQYLNKAYRAEVGRRAKALLDWGRILFLKENGFDARMCYYVPATVSLENVCLVATKPVS